MKMEFRTHGTHSGIDPDSARDDLVHPAYPDVPVRDASLPGAMHFCDKAERMEVLPCALGSIRQTYPNAIAYRTVARKISGMGLVFMVLVALPMAGATLVTCAVGISYLLAEYSVSVLKWAFLLGVFAVLVYASIAVFRLSTDDCFEPEDLPVVFDRRHRKVYRMLRDTPSGPSAMFRRDRLLVCEYEWSLVDAVHCVQEDDESLYGPPSHTLTFLVRKSHEDPSVIDSFTIPPGSIDEAQVGPVWEHIRRFMEEDGPHLPHPDEPLVPPLPRGSWWDSLHEVGVFRPYVLMHWRDLSIPGALRSLCSLTLLPVTLPLSLLLGTGHYLAARTAIPVRWPEIVMERIGAPLSEARAPNGKNDCTSEAA